MMRFEIIQKLSSDQTEPSIEQLTTLLGRQATEKDLNIIKRVKYIQEWLKAFPEGKTPEDKQEKISGQFFKFLLEEQEKHGKSYTKIAAALEEKQDQFIKLDDAQEEDKALEAELKKAQPFMLLDELRLKERLKNIASRNKKLKKDFWKRFRNVKYACNNQVAETELRYFLHKLEVNKDHPTFGSVIKDTLNNIPAGPPFNIVSILNVIESHLHQLDDNVPAPAAPPVAAPSVFVPPSTIFLNFGKGKY